MKLAVEVGGETVTVDVTGGDGRYRVAFGDVVADVDARPVSPCVWSLVIDGASHEVGVSEHDGATIVDVDGEVHRLRVEEAARHAMRTRGGRAGAAGQVLKAPMPGKVVVIQVTVGQTVAAGDALLVLEAMKMENEFRATGPGVVKEVRVEAGQAVNPGDVLVVIE